MTRSACIEILAKKSSKIRTLQKKITALKSEFARVEAERTKIIRKYRSGVAFKRRPLAREFLAKSIASKHAERRLQSAERLLALLHEDQP